jgi:GNAT superfamily N-acetyltransferase
MQSFVHASRLPLLLRTERLLQDDQGVFERIAGGWLMLTPHNPTFWWGNTLFMDQPPAEGDVVRWSKRFQELVHARQPASRHMTFGWEGTSAGAIDQFLAQGFNFFSLIALRASFVNPPASIPEGIELRALGDADWQGLVDFMVEQRIPGHRLETYRPFVVASIANWQRLTRLDRGNGYGAFSAGRLVASLGLFVEAHADAEGRRVARFQQIMTAARWRRKGIAAALLAFASNHICLRHAPSDLVIQAEEQGDARRVYQRLGFEIVGSSFGLERGPADLKQCAA